MATVNPRIASIVAHMPGVVAAVRAERDKVADIAEGLFAPHDNPGGHEITRTEGDDTDAFVNLDGPAPLALELGHWVRLHNGTYDNQFVEGLHIFGRAIGRASA